MAEQSEAEKIEAEITTYPTIRDDLNRVRSNEFSEWGKTPLTRLMDELIEAVKLAEPLPEWWVLYETPSGDQGVLWHRDGKLFQWKDDEAHWSTVESVGRHRLTPLRTEIPAEDIERAAICVYEEGNSAVTEWPADVGEVQRAESRDTARAILRAAGIEAEPSGEDETVEVCGDKPPVFRYSMEDVRALRDKITPHLPDSWDPIDATDVKEGDYLRAEYHNKTYEGPVARESRNTRILQIRDPRQGQLAVQVAGGPTRSVRNIRRRRVSKPNQNVITLDMSPWPLSTAADWRHEAKVLREAKPNHLPAASLCDAVADALVARER